MGHNPRDVRCPKVAACEPLATHVEVCYPKKRKNPGLTGVLMVGDARLELTTSSV